MHKKCKWIALVVVICMFATMFPTISKEKYEASEKVGSDLLELMNVSYDDLTTGNFVDSGETYSCIIWIEDVEIEEAVEAGIDAAEMTRENYSTWSLYDYPYTTYEADGLTYVDVTFDETESDEYVQTYIEAERDAAAELYSENNNSFVAENFMARDMSVTYVSRYSPCVFADLNVTKMAELIKQSEVVCIEYSNNEIEATDATDSTVEVEPILRTSEIEECMEVVRVDEATDVYNITGEGVRIGQIELACPEKATVRKNPSFNGTMVEGVVTNHANNVYAIMNMVAPDATYYATARRMSNTADYNGSFYEQVEWLLSQGVNIINMSCGTGGANSINKYTAEARWVDHIAYNHDVHFVMASGNEMENDAENTKGVISPGMAYNIITVGNTYADYDCPRYPDSSYNTDNSAGLTYKPDVMAPGTYIASNTYGTSYSAPIVTGVVALMCEYKPALKTQQHIVKAILAATCSTMRRYVTMDAGFEEYGAGLIDARSAIYAIYKGNYSISTGSLAGQSAEKTYQMTVTSSDTCMRVALAYANRIEFDTDSGSHSQSEIPTGTIASVALEVYSPDNELVVSLTSNYLVREANLKVVEFDPREYGTGTYIIKVKLVIPASGNRTTNFGVAWR